MSSATKYATTYYEFLLYTGHPVEIQPANVEAMATLTQYFGNGGRLNISMPFNCSVSGGNQNKALLLMTLYS